MDINLVKNVINGVNLVKIGHFWWKYSKLGHFGDKMTPKVEIWEKGQKKPKKQSLKVYKNYFIQVYGHKFGEKWHYWGQFCQNMSFLVKIAKIGSFWGPKWRHRPNFWEIGQKISTLKVYKNYFSQVYGHKFGQICH